MNIVIFLLFILYALPSFAGNSASSNNFENSPNNFDNSPYNFQNSPNNFKRKNANVS